MCLFSSPKTPKVEEPQRYQQQRTPTRRDTEQAQDRASMNRKRATKTLLADYTEDDQSGKKTLLGA